MMTISDAKDTFPRRVILIPRKSHTTSSCDSAMAQRFVFTWWNSRSWSRYLEFI